MNVSNEYLPLWDPSTGENPGGVKSDVIFKDLKMRENVQPDGPTPPKGVTGPKEVDRILFS